MVVSANFRLRFLTKSIARSVPSTEAAADATDSALRMPAGTAAPSAAPPSSSTTSAAAAAPAAHSPAPQVDFYGEPHPPVLHICASRAALQGVPCRLVEAIAKNATGATYSSTGDAGVPKGGCVDHRNTTQQAALGSRLAPVLARAAGWGGAAVEDSSE